MKSTDLKQLLTPKEWAAHLAELKLIRKLKKQSKN